MFSHKKFIIGALGVSLLSFNAAKAVPAYGDYNYPLRGEDQMTMEALKTQHEMRKKQATEEYQKKMQAMDVRYNEQIKQADEFHKQMMEKREKMASMKAERIEARNKLQNEYANKRTDLETKHLEESNHYVLVQKDKEEYFRKKKEAEERNKQEVHESNIDDLNVKPENKDMPMQVKPVEEKNANAPQDLIK
jgi:hypothetical protein